MKTVKRIFVTGMIISCYVLSEAQQLYTTPSQWLYIHKNEIKNSPYIFEGKVIRYSSMKTVAVTCFVLQVTKIYKGSPQITLGTIKVIVEANEETSDMGSSFLRKGYSYILFCDSYNSHIYDSIATNNSIVVTYTDNAIIQGKGVQWDDIPYSTRDSLYSFFQENGLTIQQETPKQ